MQGNTEPLNLGKNGGGAGLLQPPPAALNAPQAQVCCAFDNSSFWKLYSIFVCSWMCFTLNKKPSQRHGNTEPSTFRQNGGGAGLLNPGQTAVLRGEGGGRGAGV